MDIPYKDFPVAPGEKDLHTVWCFSLPVKASELWPYIADTSRFNRQLGMASRTEQEIDGKNLVTTKMLGMKQQWVEQPWTWFKDQSIESLRDYTEGMAKRVRSRFFFEPTPTGVNFYVNFSWIPKNYFWYYFLKLTSPILKKNFAKVLQIITTSIQSKKKSRFTGLKITNDPSTNVNLEALGQVEKNLKASSLNPKAVDALLEFIKTGDDIDLFRIKALALAQNVELPKQDVIKTCMESVRQGLLAISWDVVCPHCRGVRLSAKNLGEIPVDSDCMACEVDFQTDTFDSIEVVFHVHPTYRKVTEVLFCAAEPAKKDHIQVQQKLAPFQKLDFSQHLKEGRHRLRVTNPTMNFYFDVQEGCPSTEICWDLESESEKVICGRETIFKIQNSKNQVRNLSIEQLWWVDDILHPADIFSLTEYRDVFSKDSLESNVKISLGVQVIMFTDIVNSTNFYNQKGDAAAFNDVKKHFLEAFDIARRHDGAVIKTIGDSIMASFSDPDKALKAAVLIQETFHSSREDTSIRLRISLHLGQVIAVHLLQGIDLFGATINKAAKLQACANTGEIACSDEFFKTITRPSSENWEAFTEKRQSSLVFKETLLQAHVIQCHKMMDHKKQKSA